MNRELIADYINLQPSKVVSALDLNKGKIAYTEVKQWREIKDIRGGRDSVSEELVRAFVLTKLANQLGYAPSRIEVEREYTAGRPHTITSRIDVIVRDSNDNAFLFIELKSPTDYAVIDKDAAIEEQLFKLAGMERQEGNKVKYLVLYTVSEIAGKITA